MQETHNRAFKGVWISKDIWLAKDLGWTEKLLLVEIDSLDGEYGCFASNEYLANFFSLSKDRISRMVSSLKKKGYITVEMQYKEGTKEIEKRIIRLIRNPIGEIANTYRQKQQDPIGENTNTPIGENAKDNNTFINNTSNNTDKDKDIGDQSVGQSLAYSDNDFLTIRQLFEQNVRIATFKDCEKINEAMEFYETPLILEAVKAGATSARSFNYILGILDNWRKEFAVKTYQDWELKIQQKGGQSNASCKQPNGPNTSRTPEEMDMLAKLRTYSSAPRTN